MITNIVASESTMSTVEQIAQQIGRLPEPLQQEVLDFVEFLQSKHHIPSEKPSSGSLLELQGGLERSTTFSGDELKLQERLRAEWD
ncbi:DUF2281 domain-containing protein [Halomonas cerina]|uniref:DUF2281 domain-containing protein n=1 Tax=Halomonas cerina TaxID=447424 RepID=A0A839V9P2_9GAMM|nr:DUF2281 domain-containing protein [Halomonas cerina]MBB3189424.1 hypothetical protein [Halomonas cerina]